MNVSLLIGEDFLENPHAARKFALSQEFRTVDFQGEKWRGVATDWGTFPIHRLSNLMGFPVINVGSFFRLNIASETERARVHVDNHIYGAEWAGVVYLSTPEQDLYMNSGTATFRHLPTQHDFLPSIDFLEACGLGQEHYDKIDLDGLDESKWMLTGLSAMKQNRITVYPASVFHSRYPFEMEYGDTKETGRLTWVCFFRSA